MNLPEGLSDLAERPRNIWAQAGQNQRYAILGGFVLVFLALFIGVMALGGNGEEWEPAILYANLDYQEAAEISNRLGAIGIDYKLTEDASTIVVPKDQVRDLRLQLAGEGFPKSGRMGYEIFEEAQLAMTDFLQKVNFQRALQEELEETLMDIEGVRNVRIHLVIPEPSLFTEEQNPVTASVTLALVSGTKLKPKKIDAIAHLVGASVEGLDVENVVIVDSEGNMLTEEKDPLVNLANKQFRMQQQVEYALEKKVQTLMDEVIGKDRSKVRVNVELDFSQQDRQEQVVTPGATQVIISEETNEKSSAEQGTEEQAIRNYEVNRTVRNIIGSVGSINRLSMALTIDKTKVIWNEETEVYEEENRPQEEIQNLEKLAKKAVGFSDERGDQIEVFPMPFDKSQDIQAKREAKAEERQLFWTDIAINVAKILLIIGALVVLRFVIKAIGRGVGMEEELEVLGEVQTEVDAEDDFERPETPHEIILRRVQDMVRDRPEDSAKLIRTMLLEEQQ